LIVESTFPAPENGYNPYWIKAIQCDGQMAWSSPVYVESDTIQNRRHSE